MREKVLKMLRRWRPEKKLKDVWLLRSLAMVISLMLWFSLLGGKKELVEKNASLKFIVPKGWVITDTSVTDVKFLVAGAGPFLKDLEEKDLEIPIEIKEPTEGPFEIKLTNKILKSQLGFKTVTVTPESVTVKIEPIFTRSIPIRPSITNVFPIGIKVDKISVNPSMIRVVGPKSRLDSLDFVSTKPISLGMSQKFQEHRSTLALEGGIKISPEALVQDPQIKVNVWLNASLAQKWIRGIPVSIKWGDLDSKALRVYKESIVEVLPRRVDLLVEGPGFQLNKLAIKDLNVWVEVEGSINHKKKVSLAWTLPAFANVLGTSVNNAELRVKSR